MNYAPACQGRRKSRPIEGVSDGWFEACAREPAAPHKASGFPGPLPRQGQFPLIGLCLRSFGGENIADILIREGLARPYDGGRRTGWCGWRRKALLLRAQRRAVTRRASPWGWRANHWYRDRRTVTAAKIKPTQAKPPMIMVASQKSSGRTVRNGK